jgi:hypothetical protein
MCFKISENEGSNQPWRVLLKSDRQFGGRQMRQMGIFRTVVWRLSYKDE